ncbi:unnamed protein product [Cuscuta campestris]|uniref:Uncharacterized protein n=1 Tax=Cuscuta campestris TaxID=132261 RepID=A0A484LBJ4_9ASTE|nr:unnamed protein product [Cuscuta campestris]
MYGGRTTRVRKVGRSPVKLSRTKTEYKICSFSGGVTKLDGEVSIDSHLVPKRDKFCYLGPTFQTDGKINTDVAHHIGATWAKWELASGALYDKKILAIIKGNFYKFVVRPTIMYKAKCWAVKKIQIPRLHVAEMQMLRWIFGQTRGLLETVSQLSSREYCERHAKKENISTLKEDSDEDEISDEYVSGHSDSDDEVVGHADP